MSALPTDGYRLTGISPKAWEHPADKAASAALNQIPYLDSVIRKLLGLGYERAAKGQLLGGGLRLNEKQLPEIHTLHRSSYVTLDWEPIPPVYLLSMPDDLNAFSFGVAEPVVAMGAPLMDLLEGDGEALRSVFAHEAGHVVSDHMLYRTVTRIMLQLGSVLPLPFKPILYALLEWSRASELTCDRAAALITRDPMALARTLMVLSSGVRAERLNLDEFLVQGQEYTDGAKGIQRIQRMLSDLGVTHPAPAKRIKELMLWVQSGEYDRIVSGEYPTRDQDFRPREMAGEAADHYGEKFSAAFKDLQAGLGEAGDQAQEYGSKVSEWLRGQAGRGGS